MSGFAAMRRCLLRRIPGSVLSPCPRMMWPAAAAAATPSSLTPFRTTTMSKALSDAMYQLEKASQQVLEEGKSGSHTIQDMEAHMVKMQKAYDNWFEIDRLETKKREEEFKLAVQRARRSLDNFGASIDELKRSNKIAARVVVGMYVTLVACIGTDQALKSSTNK